MNAMSFGAKVLGRCDATGLVCPIPFWRHVRRTFHRYLMRSLEKEDEKVDRQNFLRPSTRYRRQKLNKSTTLFPF